MTYLYGVFHGTKWGMTRNKRSAIETAKRRGGYVVRNRYEAQSAADRRAGLIGGWDAPTFDMVGELIYGVRQS